MCSLESSFVLLTKLVYAGEIGMGMNAMSTVQPEMIRMDTITAVSVRVRITFRFTVCAHETRI